MVASAIEFYATTTDQMRLLDHLGEPDGVTLRPWPLVHTPPRSLTRSEALSHQRVMVVDHRLGPPTVFRAHSSSMGTSARSWVFNQINWARLRSRPDDGLVDSDSSPVLLWCPSRLRNGTLLSGSIGSQAESMSAVSADFVRWTRRVTDWVRRHGTKVWGLDGPDTRPDLHIDRTDVTTVYAMADALADLEGGRPAV